MKIVQRTFTPGSEWLYVKLYTGNKTADKILVKTIRPVIRELEKQKVIDRWFFIRYSDPDFHLRIRFHLPDINQTGMVMILLHEKLKYYVKHNLVWKIQYDTYNRELERYRNDLIEESEELFRMDSDCILSLVGELNTLPDENYRWMIALKMMDSFLSTFSYDLSQKAFFFTQRSEAFKREFSFNEHNAKQFNLKYREHKKTVEAILKGSITDANVLSLYLPLKKYVHQLKPLVNIINQKIGKQNDLTIDSLIGSYIHMMLNRLFRSKNRKHELVLYDFMRRYYESEQARAKYQSIL